MKNVKPVLFVVIITTVAVASYFAPSNIDPIGKWSWSENAGWLNWRDAAGTNEGVEVLGDHLAGKIWSERAGWINVGNGGAPYANTNDTNFGVNIVSGDLDGMAWSENKGWINFGWAAGTANADRARFDGGAGRFRGYAWGENIGWINLDDATHFVAAEVSSGAPDPPVAAGSYDRALGMVLPVSVAGTATAYRVTLVTLYRPSDPQPQDQPDFSAFESEVRYLNMLRDGNGDVVTECVSSSAFGTTYPCVSVGCDPEFADWGTLFGGATVYASGNAIVPDSEYTVAQLAASCEGNEAACAAVSDEINFATARYGDTQLDDLVNVTDVVLTVDVVKNVLGAAWEYQCYVRKEAPEPQNDSVNVTDIVLHVDALKLLAYPLNIPICP
jgi:hypothetical protein